MKHTVFPLSTLRERPAMSSPCFLPIRQLRLESLAPLSFWNDGRPVRQHFAAVMNQTFQSMSRDVQGNSIDGILVAFCGLGALPLQDIVDLVFDRTEFDHASGLPYPSSQDIQSVQRGIRCRWSNSQKLP